MSRAAPPRPLPEILRLVRRLEVRARRLVTESFAGEYASVFKGRGIEFADVREYQPGDDVRAIDWPVTARTGTAHVRRHAEERDLTVLFLVDRSASGAFGSRRRTKADLAVEACALLAVAAARKHDRVGALLFTDRVERLVPPAKGRKHALRVVRELVGFEPAGRGTDLAGALALATRLFRRRAVVFLVSDFLASGYERALRAAARRHDLIALQVVDPRERDLPDVGLVVLRDPESGRWQPLDTSRAGVREAVRRRAADADRRLLATLEGCGADLARLETGASPVGPLLALFRRRARARGARPAASA